MKTTEMVLIFVSALGLTCVSLAPAAAGNQAPVADAGSSRYAAADPVQLDGSGSYDPDSSGPLSYAWRQISGPPVIIVDANIAKPVIRGPDWTDARGRTLPGPFVQTDEVQECEFELVVSDGEQTSLPDTVRVIIVPDFGANTFQQENPPFDPNKPTLIYFGGGNCINGLQVDCASPFTPDAWLSRVNIINFRNGYTPDSGGSARTYYKYGDMIIAHLSAVAPDYKRPIQTIGWSTGGQPAVDVGIHLNLNYADARYAVNRVTFFDAIRYCRNSYAESITTYLGSSVDGEQCWADAYVSTTSGMEGYAAGPPFQENVLNVWFPSATGGWYNRHILAHQWYVKSLTLAELNNFNDGVVAGAYWSVVGPGKNLQLASTPNAQTYRFEWYGLSSSGHMDFYDEANHPGRLPEPVTLLGPADGAFVDGDGVVLSCEESQNAVGYQLLFGSDPDHMVYLVSDTAAPPDEVIATFPFEVTWWTIKARDQYGSTIYADPLCIRPANSTGQTIKNLNSGKTFGSIQQAISRADSGDEIVVKPGAYQHLENINFKGKSVTVRSANPDDPAVVAATTINGGNRGPVVTFSSGEDASSVLAGFTIVGGNADNGGGIYCGAGSSPTVSYCVIAANSANLGGGIYNAENGSPTVTNCTVSGNSASAAGGGMYNDNGSLVVTNCTFTENSASFGAGICGSGDVALTNCILWGDMPDEVQVFAGTLTVEYSDIQGGFVGEGEWNIDADPLFADPGSGDYHLKSQAGRWEAASQSWVKDDVTSPCIDAGDPGSDWADELWPHGKRINMGAYGGTAQASMSLLTVGNAADCNHDGSVDARDLLALSEGWLSQDARAAEDINRSGSVDFLDYARLVQDWLGQEP